jgi:hypothetical protein
MRRLTWQSWIAAAALALATAGCGGGGAAAPDAGTAGRDGAAAGSSGSAGTGGNAGMGGAAGTGGKAGSTGGGAGTGGLAGTGGASGPPGSSIKKLVAGQGVALVGSGEDSCTNLPGAKADRWCAFLRDGTTALELWVVNATALASGAAVTCDGTSPACVRLSQTIFYDPDFGGTQIHHFYGDTLIYYADASPTAASFSGTIWAWQPGWTTGRKLTSAIGNDCTASKRGDAIACIQGSAEIVAGELSVELLAGRPPLTANAPLPTLERIVVASINDPPNVQKWQLAFSDDGAYVAWSARDKAASPETLKVQKLEDAGSRKTVATDVSRWQMTPDGKSWLWLRTFNYDAAAPSGTLETAPFPAGTPTTALGTGVAMYQGFGDGSILFQTATGGELRRMPNPATPAATQLLDSAILGVLDFSTDGATVVYAKDIDNIGLIDIWARAVTASAPCAVAGPSQALQTVTMFNKGGTVLWARLDPGTGDLQGMATVVNGCKSTPFANNVLRWIPAGDDALTILDDTSPADQEDSTLRYSRAVNGVLPAQGTLVQTHVMAVYGPLLPTLPVALYTSATQATAGLYAYIGPPLVGTTAPATDGGVPDGGTDAPAGDASDGGTVSSDDADASDAGGGGDGNTGG